MDEEEVVAGESGERKSDGKGLWTGEADYLVGGRADAESDARGANQSARDGSATEDVGVRAIVTEDEIESGGHPGMGIDCEVWYREDDPHFVKTEVHLRRGRDRSDVSRTVDDTDRRDVEWVTTEKISEKTTLRDVKGSSLNGLLCGVF